MSEARAIDQMEDEEMELCGLEEVPVLDDASAEMVLKQLRMAENQYDRMKAWYDHQIKNLQEIRDRTRVWAEACLRPYMDMVPTTGKKIRSYDMPGGTLKLSAQDPEYKPVDDELVPWLEKNGLVEFVEVKKTARWGEFKETIKVDKKVKTLTDENGVTHVVTPDGEIVPGVNVTIREDKFTIKCK